MKKLIVLSFAFLSLLSCSKKTPCTPIVKTDTVVLEQKSIIGNWTARKVNIRDLTITKDSFLLKGNSPDKYYESENNIYFIYQNKTIDKIYSYSLSQTKDTLNLYPSNTINDTVIYFRVIN